MSLGNWLKGREATVEELREQLNGAEGAHAEALTAVSAAQVAFDESGSDASAKALLKAREAVGLAEAHVERAKRLLEAGERRESEIERQRLMARKAELEAKLTATAIKAETVPFDGEELALLLQVAQCRARRIARGSELRSLEVELLKTRRTLGEDVDAWAFNQATNPLITPVAMGEAFDERCRGLDEPLRSLLRTLKPTAESYEPRNGLPIYAPPQPVKK